ncbi:glucose/quinate/shikimate family membrane-bound PQQ-dependent dehydrogenase [Pseudomonas sp. EpS/L25]|uniref:glucose/quinate/shikimate family membrane-bound PQQ-dependent dehydrogenase n=1 Tax=Pseudomonas sp. EpS/L25 TaxID=1749078 RepID=UPI0007436E17|nr:glucose/quinate/shikimate family membrane-bound PQQ-dependent dehydrogenase [Pseudomonas sp. EpS/L25]KUM44916.1 glucose dehydrogenase [Pseudomonas sp. EpS/L25]
MSGNGGALGACKFLVSALGVLIALLGLALGGGGVYLATLGGSPYFALGGVLLTLAGVLIAIRRPLGAWLYALFLLATLIWALADVGLVFWPLVSRLMMFAVIGAVVALAYPALVRARGGVAGKGGYVLAGLLAVACATSFAWMFKPQPLVAATTTPAITPVTPETAQKDWRSWGNTTAGTRFAALDQITKANVGELQVAWTFRTGDVPQSNGFGAEDQETPLQVGDTLYLCSPHNQVFAVDADTGAKRWSFDPKANAPNWQRCRGVGYHEDAPAAQASAEAPATPAQPATACLRRILTTTIDARLFALDADTGKPCADFGDNGMVDLKAGMGQVKPGFYTLTAAPLVAGDLIVIGGRVADNIEVNEPSGVIRAFDVHTGKKVWAWDLAKEKPDTPLDPNIDYTRATPNVWTSMAYDAKLGLIYLPTGNTTPDAWGGERTPQDDKYSSAVVALDAKTGQERWVYQTVHHDLWDYDLPSQPTLVDVPDGQGGTLPGLIQTTKAGQVFLLNRETGQPIAEVREQPVKAPVPAVDGERHAPTQPVSVGMPSIGTETLTESAMWGATPYDQLICRIQFKKMRYDGLFTAPSTDVSLQWPGSLGGMNWGSNSIDPTTGYLFVNDMRLGLWTRLIPRAQMENDKAGGVEMGAASQTGTPYGSLRNRFLSPLGIPCQAPPYGTMTAIDLKTRKVAWQVPVGTVQDTGPLGIKLHLPIPIGMPTLGGSLATQSGLLFFAGTQDYYLRAYDSGTGREIWRARLPVGSQGTPITYVSPKTGKQYVVISAGGARQSPDRGDYVIAYALPDKR